MSIITDVMALEQMANSVLIQKEEQKQNEAAASENALEIPDTFLQIQNERRLDAHIMAFRSRHPFIDVMPFPRMVRTVYAKTNDFGFDLEIPDGAEMMRVDAPANVYFYLSQSKIYPLTSLSDSNNNQDFLVSPVGQNFWVKGVRHLYGHIPALGDAVSFSFFVDL